MNDDRKLLVELLRLVDQTETHEIDCDEFLHRSAGLVESITAATELPDGWQDLVQHLRVCPECEEEFETLRRILRDEK